MNKKHTRQLANQQKRQEKFKTDLHNIWTCLTHEPNLLPQYYKINKDEENPSFQTKIVQIQFYRNRKPGLGLKKILSSICNEQEKYNYRNLIRSTRETNFQERRTPRGHTQFL